MNDSRVGSPQQSLKKSQILSSPTNSKSKAYLPSRYAQQKKQEKVGFQDILNSIQTKTVGNVVKGRPDGSPKLKPAVSKGEANTEEKKPKTSQFKSRPLKRQKNDELQFKEIFLNPRQQALQQLKKKSTVQDNLKTITVQYEKLLQPNSQTPQPISPQLYSNMLESLESSILSPSSPCSPCSPSSPNPSSPNFYSNQISLSPPDIPSPSIPPNHKISTLSLPQLLLRARSTLSSSSLETQSHLSYFLGELYSQAGQYQESLKFYRRFLGFAKALEDVTGMGIGANRVGIGYFLCGDLGKSVTFHNQNLKLMGEENCFVGFYNVGICCREMGKFGDAIQYFQSAVNWAQEKGEEESQCIAIGQLGVTYQVMQQFQLALQKFQKSNQLCQKTKKTDLKLHNLRYILRIASVLNLKPMPQLQKIVQQAFSCAKIIGNPNILDIFRCNLGVVKGMQQAIEELGIGGEFEEIQEI